MLSELISIRTFLFDSKERLNNNTNTYFSYLTECGACPLASPQYDGSIISFLIFVGRLPLRFVLLILPLMVRLVCWTISGIFDDDEDVKLEQLSEGAAVVAVNFEEMTLLVGRWWLLREHKLCCLTSTKWLQDDDEGLLEDIIKGFRMCCCCGGMLKNFVDISRIEKK